MITRSKIRGMFLGCGIGDGAGLAVEGWPQEKITEKHGRITDYVESSRGTKGSTSDDMQLTLAVAEGLIESGFSMHAQAQKHVAAFEESTRGWGGTTKTACRNLQNGASWKQSGVSGGTRGFGNGVAMKIAPVAAYMRALVNRHPEDKKNKLEEGFGFVRDLTLMTHQTKLALCSTAGLVVAIYKCFDDDLDTETLPGYILKFSQAAKGWMNGEETDDISSRFELLSKHSEYNTQRIIAEFGGGSCYCYDSVPFSLMFFLNNPHSIEALYDCINAGGDTDTNGAIVGALLGALNGEEIFPSHLVAGLDQSEKILAVADAFYEVL